MGKLVQDPTLVNVVLTSKSNKLADRPTKHSLPLTKLNQLFLIVECGVIL